MKIIVRLVTFLQAMFILYGGVTKGQNKFILVKGPDNTYVLKPAGPNQVGPGLIDLKSLPPIPVSGNQANEAPGTNSQTSNAQPFGAVGVSAGNN